MLRIKDNEQRLVEKKQEGGFIEYSHNNNDYLMRIIEYWGWRTGGKYLVIRAREEKQSGKQSGSESGSGKQSESGKQSGKQSEEREKRK